eukprot:TRINITY_DN12968_c0_g1_i1.p1 TRINITY_DN12968_c0_g1~~TRINITY_DN12968_c0_g1_i1.p1  ORF type:complete len:425 (+),score=67.87 TRINITY_DN12968_c0_g1_i1:233-1507(+)
MHVSRKTTLLVAVFVCVALLLSQPWRVNDRADVSRNVEADHHQDVVPTKPDIPPSPWTENGLFYAHFDDLPFPMNETSTGNTLHYDGLMELAAKMGLLDCNAIKSDVKLYQVIGHGNERLVILGVHNGQKVAVKKRFVRSSRAWWRETLNFMALDGPHLTRLVGFCWVNSTYAWEVTELAPRGDMDSYLAGVTNNPTSLSWADAFRLMLRFSTLNSVFAGDNIFDAVFSLCDCNPSQFVIGDDGWPRMSDLEHAVRSFNESDPPHCRCYCRRKTPVVESSWKCFRKIMTVLTTFVVERVALLHGERVVTQNDASPFPLADSPLPPKNTIEKLEALFPQKSNGIKDDRSMKELDQALRELAASIQFEWPSVESATPPRLLQEDAARVITPVQLAMCCDNGFAFGEKEEDKVKPTEVKKWKPHLLL